MRKTLTYSFLSLLFFSACSNESTSIEQRIYEDVINEVYSEITNDFKNLNDTNEVLINPVDDHLDSMTITRLIKDTTMNIADHRYELLLELNEVLNDSLPASLKKISEGHKFLLIDNKNEIENYDFNKSNYVGSSTLSKVVLSETMDNGMFYVDVQFGKNRGFGGFIVEVKKESNVWVLSQVLPLWN